MLNQAPDKIAVWTDVGRDDAAADVGVRHEADSTYSVEIDARSSASLTCVALRWIEPVSEGARVLGDHWERGYGDLEWRGITPERVLPWYALVFDPASRTTHGFGVETGAAAFASWRVDEDGVTLVLDIRCGGDGVLLTGRRLHAAVIRRISSQADESPFEFARRLCRTLCATPRLPRMPVYGGNDWYFRYGANSAETVRRDSALIRDLSSSADNAPAFVIDAGWSPAGGCGGAPYECGSKDFPDMAGLADEIRGLGVRPGIWIRPLLTTEPAPENWRFGPGHPHAGSEGAYLDPSVPEVLARVYADISRLSTWGYELIKHDFTTYDILGRWGFEMMQQMTPPGWRFADHTRTSAEIIRHLYETIREAAGEAVLIGCNTAGHLGAGLFELQRTGDDTSGRHWERTRKMGVNTLAFRMPQHNVFFAADADCVGLTRDIPWDRNRQWLDLLARSGTPLFVSADPDAVGPEQRAALREAFDLASRPLPPAEPADWMNSTCPRHWLCDNALHKYEWTTFPGAAFACPA